MDNYKFKKRINTETKDQDVCNYNKILNKLNDTLQKKNQNIKDD